MAIKKLAADPKHIGADMPGFFRVLPTGFMKIRYYGFLNPASSVKLDKMADLIELAFGFEIVIPKTELEAIEPMTCNSCGAVLVLRMSILPFSIVLADSG